MMNNSAIIPANTMERDTMQIGNEEVLTLTQAAERLGLSRHTLGTQTRKGVLSAWLMGGIFFVTATEVERYRREHLGKPGPKPRKDGEVEMHSPNRTTEEILQGVQNTLDMAQRGMHLLTTEHGPERMAGLWNVATFGRAVTFALQNLRSAEPTFDKWYKPYQDEMKADADMRRMVQLRNEIEKQGRSGLSVGTAIRSFNPSTDMQRFGPPPRNAKAFFMGDSQYGGSGWEVEMQDGSVERFYVALPEDIGAVTLFFDGDPKRNVIPICTEYIAYLTRLVALAKKEFGHQAIGGR